MSKSFVNRRSIVSALGASTLWSSSQAARAQSYPSKPIRLMLPFPPGGVTDLLARGLAEKLTQRLGQPVLVDNRPGAGTVLASELVARAPADGYTLLMPASSIGYAQVLYDKAGYDPIKSFVPISQVVSVIHLLEVNSSVPATSVAELIAYLKKNPGKVNYASTGSVISKEGIEAE